MHWFIFALISPILMTLANNIDKHLVEKYFKGGGLGAMMIFSSISGLLLLPVSFIFATKSLFEIPFSYILVLVLIGILSAFAVFSYLAALEDGETSVIVPFYQTVPIFGLILGYLFLGETVSLLKVIAIPIIVLGSLILSLEIDEDAGFKFKVKPIILILFSSFIFAINAIVFKKIATEYSFWTSIFWEYTGLFLVGVFLFAFIKKHRLQFIKVFKYNKKKVLTLNISNEILVLLGNLSVEFALILAPVALVLLADSYQPLFVLFWGIIFSKFFPNMSYDKFDSKNLIKKVIGIIIIVLGSIIINIY
ncbi:MAG: EamA family transporter [Candidatus Shapirobacteria bacterium]|jgi:uncharacterized membrane protein